MRNLTYERCFTCGGPLEKVADRWMHVGQSVVHRKLRPLWLTCPVTGRPGFPRRRASVTHNWGLAFDLPTPKNPTGSGGTRPVGKGTGVTAP